MNFTEQLAHTRKYADAFWNHEIIDRPYVCVTAPTAPPIYEWTPAKSFQACMKEKYEDILVPFYEQVKRTYFGGEAIPSLEITLGPDQYAAFLGGRVEVSDEAVTTWVNPCIENMETFSAVLDRSPGSYFDKVKKYYAYAADFCKNKFMLNMLDLHSNMDAVSALRGAQNLCLDLYDCPEEVKRILGEVRKTYSSIYQMAYETGKMNEVGTIGWSPIYCEGKSAVLQCDFSCVLSPSQGKEYVFPAIEEEAAMLDHCVYHLDGKDALVHLDTILSIEGIDCIQWVPGAGQPRTLEWMELLKKIQKAGKSLWIYDWTVDEIKKYHKELEPNKVAYSVTASSEAEGEALLEYLARAT